MKFKEVFTKKGKAWQIVNIGEIADVISGQSPEGKFYNNNGDGLPFYQGKADFGEIYLNNPQKWTTQVTKIAEQKDILMSVRAPVGPVNICPFRICIGRGLAAIRPKKDLDFLFLFYVLRENQEIIKGYGSGSTFEAINREQIKKPT